MGYEYDADGWARTRAVNLELDAEGLWHWQRSRLGGNEAAISRSIGFENPKACYRSAVKENYPLVPNVPEDFPVDPAEIDFSHDEPEDDTVEG